MERFLQQVPRHQNVLQFLEKFKWLILNFLAILIGANFKIYAITYKSEIIKLCLPVKLPKSSILKCVLDDIVKTSSSEISVSSNVTAITSSLTGEMLTILSVKGLGPVGACAGMIEYE